MVEVRRLCEDLSPAALTELGLGPAIEALRQLHVGRPDVQVLVLTMSDESSVLAAALRAGASGHLVKGSKPEDIERALRSVARGQAVFGEQVAAALLAQAARRRRGSPTSTSLVSPAVSSRCSTSSPRVGPTARSPRPSS